MPVNMLTALLVSHWNYRMTHSEVLKLLAHRTYTQLVLIYLIMVIPCIAVGCGDANQIKLAKVAGAVSLDGKPLDQATVMFQPTTGGRPSFGQTDENGRYTLTYALDKPGVIPGPCTVSITSLVEDDAGLVVRKEFLPKRYHSDSELTAEVVEKENEFNFDLTSK